MEALVTPISELLTTKQFSSAEDFFQKINKSDHEGAFAHYLEQGTSKEDKIEQYNKLKEVFGEITSFQLVDSLSGTPETEETLVLQYKIQHSKRTSIEKFILIMDDGEPKIMFHNVENE